MDIDSEMAAVQARIAAIVGTDGSPGGPAPASPILDPSSPTFGSYLAQLVGQLEPANAAPAAAMVPPVAGAMTSGFGERQNPLGEGTEFHPGIDIAADEGAPIQAAIGGRVVSASPQGGYGNLITVDDGNGLSTRYAHCSRMFARVGQLVAPGDVIGEVGQTGRATGPHLHFEVRRNDEPVDPLPYLPH